MALVAPVQRTEPVWLLPQRSLRTPGASPRRFNPLDGAAPTSRRAAPVAGSRFIECQLEQSKKLFAIGLKLIIGSTRAGRNAGAVVKWLIPAVQKHKEFELDVLDLRDWPLPMFQETVDTVGDPRDPRYSDPLVKNWNRKIGEGDAFLILTPEYNHGIPAVVKNAIDSVFLSYGFRHKPVAFVGYSLGVAAAARAVEQLNQVMIEAEASPVRTQTLIPFVAAAFDTAGQPTNPALAPTLAVMLEDLAWLGHALGAARRQGTLLPPTVRIRNAVAAAQQSAPPS